MIREARNSDLPEINAILDLQGFKPMTESHILDTCLVGVVAGEVRGVIWASVGKSKSMAYVDYFAVHPHNKGIGIKLALEGMDRMRKLGVKKLVSVVREHPEFKEALRINRWIGMKMEPDLFHLAEMEFQYGE